ncbi:dihydroorotate dehydrogenase-like protein [Propionicimonas sp.]|uniref:dihydroorotate dehydrogenase-like protein n=1 Tax=Propionicimonas sp. TaxID=1955623 RepID=UPI00181FD980|nr:dihydroorotate dehydrogenase-like protein [Propionicimonas sp.]MBU3976775.1 dihydroorotate dehydrogenase-like protein [Actinomycetota bacterium]MBU3986870.1 dihydroorotate dehydrogenase-like protein [Actinomycetota bacterium]MBU4006782.1 dihydroorotate dehydrogenase-like protein [Actinomycetota bacterium]MBU4065482.1 dihydroorotate dehydrogenase-like protein [Actinomycetota bacterium]
MGFMETTYLGLQLRNPLVASAGPLTQTVDQVKKLAGTGVGAIVMHSMFAERLRRDAAHDADLEDSYAESFAEATSYFPTPLLEPDPARNYLSLVERSAAAIPIPLIASLNAADVGSWTTYAKQLADAGASALECNIYFVPGDVSLTGAEVEARHLEIVAAVTSVVQIPVAVKMSPYFSSTGNFALQLIEAGAYGLVLFNRFLQPKVLVSKMAVVSGLDLSTPADAHVPRTWIATLRNQTHASLAATSGVDTVGDVVAYLLAGADVVMTTSALVRHGAGYAEQLITGLSEWMASRGFKSVNDFRGKLAVPLDADANAYARAGYVSALENAQETYGSLA